MDYNPLKAFFDNLLQDEEEKRLMHLIYDKNSSEEILDAIISTLKKRKKEND